MPDDQRIGWQSAVSFELMNLLVQLKDADGP